jgi:hypothetical protein
MMRRISGIAILALALTAAAHHPGYSRLAAEACEIHHRFQDLKAGNSLGPVERFVFSLVLSARG